MAALSQKSFLAWHRYLSRKSGNSGFTLIELLIAIFIGGIITTTLLYLVNQLLQANQRETVRTEVQRDMQSALDYIGEDVKEAVYVYGGNCLRAAGDVDPVTSQSICPGLAGTHIPSPANSLPVLAFWKQEPFPEEVRDRCDGTADPKVGTVNIPCQASKTYALIVYYLSNNNPNGIWDGQARITRYALTQFQGGNTPTATAGYVNPQLIELNFQSWPLDADGNSLQGGTPDDTSVALVDFVDFTPDQAAAGGNPAARRANCPAGYAITPSADSLTGDFAGVGSFYACVRDDAQAFNGGSNQDVILNLRGSIAGKPGYRVDADVPFRPALQTQVLSRGVLNKQ